MWSNLLANFKPKSGYHLVLVVVYCLVFTLNVCYSQNITSNAVVPIPNVSKLVNSTSTVVPLTAAKIASSTITTTIPSPVTLRAARATVEASTEIPTSKTTVKSTTKTAPSIVKRLTTIRPNVATNGASGSSSSSSSSGIQSKSSSTTLNTEKVDSRNVRPKQKQTSSSQHQQQQQQSSQYKVLSWPSKPGGTYLIEGDFQYNCHYILIVLSLCHFYSIGCRCPPFVAFFLYLPYPSYLYDISILTTHLSNVYDWHNARTLELPYSERMR